MRMCNFIMLIFLGTLRILDFEQKINVGKKLISNDIEGLYFLFRFGLANAINDY